MGYCMETVVLKTETTVFISLIDSTPPHFGGLRTYTKMRFTLKLDEIDPMVSFRFRSKTKMAKKLTFYFSKKNMSRHHISQFNISFKWVTSPNGKT